MSAIEHRIARLVQLGLRQARYIGRPKTLFQLAMAAAAANLTLLAGSEVAGTGNSGVPVTLLPVAATFSRSPLLRLTASRPTF